MLNDPVEEEGAPDYSVTPVLPDFGGYELLEEIARGGMGVVYRARQKAPPRLVALKVLTGGELAAPRMIERFRAETTAASSLEHPNIVPIYEVGCHHGNHFFSMRLIDGLTLGATLRGRPMPGRAAASLLATVARAVHFAHQRGILHRDIKPGNILIDSAGVPHLTDFGLAKLLEQDRGTTLSGAVVGTPSYMSPEQAQGRPNELTVASDVYGLGAVLYEMLTGRPPFAGASIAETIRQLVESDPVLPRTLQPGIPTDLETICRKCLEKEPARRYASAEALADDLDRWSRDEPIAARPVSTWETGIKWARRKPAWAGLLGFTAVSLVAFTVGTALFSLRLKEERDRAERARASEQDQRLMAEGQKRQADENARHARQEQENARRALAQAHIALAEAALRGQEGSAAIEALEPVPPDLRDSTWHYLTAQADTSRAAFPGFHVGSVPIPSEPGQFAVTDRNGQVTFLHAGTGRKLRQFDLIPRQRKAIHHRGLAVSPDGRHLAVGSLAGGGIALYQLSDGRPVADWEAIETDQLEFSPDGEHLLQSSIKGRICLWNIAAKRPAWEITGVTCGAFLPDGRTIVVARSRDLALVDADTGRIERPLCPIRAVVPAVAVRPDGNMVAFGDVEGFVRGVDVASGGIVFDRPAHNHLVRFITFTPDGERLVTVADAENKAQSIQVWDAQTGGHLQALLGGGGRAESLRIHPTTHELLVTGPHTKSWLLRYEKPKWRLAEGGAMVFFGGDDTFLGRTRRGLGQYQLAEGAASMIWKRDGGRFGRPALSADGTLAAIPISGSRTSSIVLLRQQGNTVAELPAIGVASSISFARPSPSGDRVLIFQPGGTCSGHFSIGNGHRLAPLQSPEIEEVIDATWLDETRVAGAVIGHAPRGSPNSQELLALWELPSGRLLRTVPSPAPIQVIARSPDGHRFAEAGDDKLIRVHDSSSLEVQTVFRAHDAVITGVAWHPTRPILASASADLTVKLWNVNDGGRLLGELRGPLKPITTLHISPSGRRVTGSFENQTWVWEPEALAAP